MRSVLVAFFAIVMIASAPDAAFTQTMLPAVPAADMFVPVYNFGSPRPATAKPSISAGYVWDSRKTRYSFTAHGTGLGGATERRLQSNLSTLHVSGTIPVIMRNQGGIVVTGGWAIPCTDDAPAEDFNPPGTFLDGRTWRGRTTWATAEVLLAYSIRPGFSGLVGYRWDYWHTGYDNPRDETVGFFEAAPTDSADYRMKTWMPFMGLALNFSGLRSAVIVGVTSSGTVEYEEVRNGSGSQRLDVYEGDSGKAYFLEATGEYTVASGSFRGSNNAELCLFGRYSYLKHETDVTGRRTGTFTAQDTFDFEMRRDLFVAGAEASVTF